MPSPTAPVCPNAANHVPHPTTYVAHSSWADDALRVADQKICDGCGRWELWVPKRPDLRIAANWPPPYCDWGGCDAEGVGERFWPEVEMSTMGEFRAGRWLPVCAAHIGRVPGRRSPGRGDCVGCGRSYTLTGEGLLRMHSHGFERCVGSGRAPRGGAG